MKIAILGMPQAGQRQLFTLLSGIAGETIMQKPLEVHRGVSRVRDPRVAKFEAIFKPKKTTYTQIEFVLLPDFNLQGPLKELLFKEIKNADELCFVTRSETAEADIANFISELAIADLILAEKRLETIAKEQQKKFAAQKEKEKELMEICKKELDAEKLLIGFPFSEDQIKNLRAYQFLTLKPLVVVVNVAEDKIKDETISSSIRAKFSLPTVQLCAEIEEEINTLEAAERVEFMKELGIEEPALDKITRISYEGLGLISFFTVGEDEVRAWPVRKGATAPEAGSVIHSDIEKGFVRAEMMKYDDFIRAGSESKLKEEGKFSLKGRDYIVEDGDILNFRFNV